MKIPLGISSFFSLRKEGYYYVDKTPFLHRIESNSDKYLVLLRPRRFGKTLFVNMMGYYYDRVHKAHYQELFHGTWIYDHPTPGRNQYLVLNMNFSGINTQTLEKALFGFTQEVCNAIRLFMSKYNEYFPSEDQTRILSQPTAETMLSAWALSLQMQSLHHKVFVLIDEYDHFANNILTQGKEVFHQLVHTDGYVRPFYEALKKSTETVVDRIFITGVLPILLDSLTSGFNIATHISTREDFHEIMGFTQDELDPLLQSIHAQDDPRVKEEIRTYYDGYRFSSSGKTTLYNSDMVLHYFRQHQTHRGRIEQMVDPNVITDYTKIRTVLSIGTKELERQLVEKVVQQERIHTQEIAQQFVLTSESSLLFDGTKVLSLLFYMGFLTIQEKDDESLVLRVPNLVMKMLYWDYLLHLQSERSGYQPDNQKVEEMVSHLMRGDAKPLIRMTEAFLKSLSNLDYRRFDEKYIKMVILSLVRNIHLYIPHSEYPIGSVGYADLFLQAVFQPERFTSYLIELKYIKARQSASIAQKRLEEGKAQMLRYRKAAGSIAPNLKCLVLVFQKDRCIHFEEC